MVSFCVNVEPVPFLGSSVCMCVCGFSQRIIFKIPNALDALVSCKKVRFEC